MATKATTKQTARTQLPSFSTDKAGSLSVSRPQGTGAISTKSNGVSQGAETINPTAMSAQMSAAQNQIREFAAKREKEGHVFSQMAQNVCSAIGDPELKMSQKDYLKRSAILEQTINAVAIKEQTYQLEATLLKAATNSIDVAERSYGFAAQVSKTQEKESYDAMHERRRDANILTHEYMARGYELTAEKTKFKFERRVHLWDGGAAPWDVEAKESK